MLEGIAAARGLELRDLAADPTRTHVAGVRRATSLVVLSHVGYRIGRARRHAGAHAAARARTRGHLGPLRTRRARSPSTCERAGAELAVGCTYKYLNAGPGRAGVPVRRDELQAALRTPIQGWFGQRDQFAMERAVRARAAASRASSPARRRSSALAAVEEGARITAEAGIERAAREVDRPDRAARSRCTTTGSRRSASSSARPRDAARRGSHVSLRHPRGVADLPRADRARRRHPRLPRAGPVRLGIAPLYTRFVDVWDAIDRLRGLVERGEHATMAARRSRVT